MNILIPTDFSENSWNAIRYALAFFESVPAHVYFLHVVSDDIVPAMEKEVMVANPGDTLTLPKAPFSAFLKKLKKIEPSQLHHFHTAVVEGSITEIIREKIDEYKIDMIVMGTNGASGYKEATVGSHTTDVIIRVKCPILVIPSKARYHRPSSICLPTDFNNSFKKKVVNILETIVGVHDSLLKVLYVSKTNEQLSPLQEEHKSQLKGYLFHLKHSFHFTINQTLEEAVEAFVRPREIAMIAMMAKNLNFFHHILFHPAANRISYHSEIPFLVLHE